MACSACNIVVLLWWYIFALYSHLWPLYCVQTGFNDLHFSLDTAEYLYTYACVIVSIDTGRVSGHLWFGGELLVICVSVGGDLYLSLSIVICIQTYIWCFQKYTVQELNFMRLLLVMNHHRPRTGAFFFSVVFEVSTSLLYHVFSVNMGENKEIVNGFVSLNIKLATLGEMCA